MTEKKPVKSFAKLFEELESIAKEFEDGKLDLDESVKKFERGLDLAHELKLRLSDIEKNVKKIQQRFSEGDKI